MTGFTTPKSSQKKVVMRWNVLALVGLGYLADLVSDNQTSSILGCYIFPGCGLRPRPQDSQL